MTCTNCSTSIEKHLSNSVEGILDAKVNLLVNKAYVKHDLNIIRPRKIIEEISDIGFEAELQPENENLDIREITKAEVTKFKKKFLLCLFLYLPMVILIWIIPYVGALTPFMTSVQLFNGITLYVFIAFVLSTII